MNTIIFSSLVVLICIILLASYYIIPKLTRKHAIEDLITIHNLIGGVANWYDRVETIINRLSDLHDIKVRRSKWGKGWFVRGTRTTHVQTYEGKSIKTTYEYFPVDKDSVEGTTRKVAGKLHAPDSYLPTKEAAQALKELLLHRLFDEVWYNYEEEVKAKTTWED